MGPLINYGYVAANIYFVGTCNLKCVYCFQPKICDTMRDVNKKIVDWIRSGEMEDDIEKYIGKNVESFSLWGGEPSINLPHLMERAKYLYDRFPKLNAIFYSTNISTRKLAQNSVDFVNEITRLNKIYRERGRKPIRVEIQVSIDGPPEINDPGRIGSSAVGIMDNITYLLEELNKIPTEERCFSIHGKSTMSAETIRWFMQPNEKYGTNLEYHFRFFDDYHYKWSQFCDFYPRIGGITLVYPGNYTQDDGKVYAELTKLLLSEEFRNKDWKVSPDFNTQTYSRVADSYRILNNTKFKTDTYELMSNCSCSAGRSCAGISYDRKFHWCQSTYFFDDEVNSKIVNDNLVSDFEKSYGFSFKNFNNYVKDVEVVPYDDDLRLARTLNLTDRFWTNASTRLQYMDLMVRELAIAGQIDECFLTPEWRNLAVTYLLYGGNECPADNTWEHGSPYIRNTAHMKLMFNGAFQHSINYIKEHLSEL